MRRGGVVLAGGRSTRMGVDKASLEWHGEPLLAHVVRAVDLALREAHNGVLRSPLVVVRAPGQVLPPLPSDVEVVEDSVAGRGPLQALRDGLRTAGNRADVVFVAATDVPLLRPELVRAVVAAVAVDVDIAVPLSGGRAHPLTAGYRTSLVPLLDELLASGELRVGALLERCRVCELDEARLRSADPGLVSLVNVNTRADLVALDRRRTPAPD